MIFFLGAGDVYTVCLQKVLDLTVLRDLPLIFKTEPFSN
jgi:hypothetical protein